MKICILNSVVEASATDVLFCACLALNTVVDGSPAPSVGAGRGRLRQATLLCLLRSTPLRADRALEAFDVLILSIPARAMLQWRIC